MNELLTLAFDQADLGIALGSLDDTEIDNLDFGVLGFDAGTVVRRYNAFESMCANWAPHRILGQPLFTVVSPCMNNCLVAQRFEDAASGAGSLDATIDYVLTLRMRPVKVKLRLLAANAMPLRYVLVQRSS